ncbi:MAG TPA: 30S ribosomal protein S4 [Firmicutes bacterium]|jgi:small subunit ribosomal protein S4|nr:MAG: 30S ribosomal protein S4 [Peptococcaceae bacterium 1109]HHT72691.1 30S ribosomal protein S4 [Bacillota bacterium]
MSRYTGPTWKLSRRLGFSLSETGKELRKRPYPPGQHGQGRRKLSNYAIQLQEKQKLRFLYGLSERQFKRVFQEAARMQGITGENFMILLESRLDNLVYRLGFARSRAGARQLVTHGHVTVNGKKVDIPSYRVKVGDKISLREKSRNLKVVQEALEVRPNVPEYLSYDENTMTGEYVRLPRRDELNPDIKESEIVEFYSR